MIHGPISSQNHSCNGLFALLFLFNFNRSNRAQDIATRVFDLPPKHTPKMWKGSQKRFQHNSCSDWMNASYFIMQTSSYLLITASTLVQGHGKSPNTFPGRSLSSCQISKMRHRRSPSQTSGFLQNFLINLDMFFVCSIAWDIWKPWS